MMRHTMLLLFFLLLLPSALSAQIELATDTLQNSPAHERNDILLRPDVKSYSGGYLLDMNLTGITSPKPLSAYRIEIPDASKDYSSLFRLDPDITYSQGLSDRFSGSYALYPSLYGWSTGSFSATDNLQMGSFRLKSGWRLNTYGQYNKEGWRVGNPAALPWERNNFKGAFELKSANGAFGIRVEVQQTR